MPLFTAIAVFAIFVGLAIAVFDTVRFAGRRAGMPPVAVSYRAYSV